MAEGVEMVDRRSVGHGGILGDDGEPNADLRTRRPRIGANTSKSEIQGVAPLPISAAVIAALDDARLELGS